MWINGQKIVDDWNARPLATHMASISLTANTKVPIKIEYFQEQFNATISLGWAPPEANSLVLSRQVYLPSQIDWYDFWTGQQTSGGHTLDVATPIEKMAPLRTSWINHSLWTRGSIDNG